MNHARPPQKIRKPRLPLLDGQQPSKEVVRCLLNMAAYSDKAAIEAYVGPIAYNELGGGSLNLLLKAIDPETGDSALHRAAAADNIGAVSAMAAAFGPQLDQRPADERLKWVLITHQNHAGDTALHVAARAGSRRSATMIYRWFHGDGFEDLENASRGPDSDWPSAENWDWHGLNGENKPALVFICMKNKAGRDAVAEAHQNGHADLAQWLEELAAQLDVDHERTDAAAMRQNEILDLQMHWCLDDDDDAGTMGVEDLH
ncbi:hypothetical protein F5B20DRAFT_554658 [Whalleya microplaca]|nr:hypothetical protein F5B20DRAFT_554658 [Whalleya microplaca]